MHKIYGDKVLGVDNDTIIIESHQQQGRRVIQGDEQAFRFNNRAMTDAARFAVALKGIMNKRLTYVALTGSELPQTC